MKILRPPFAYYGGKTFMAKDIVPLIPKDAKNYIEPFAGSLAVLLRKEPHKCEVVNDLDNRLIRFWRVLRDRPDELQHALARTPYSRAEFEHTLSVMGQPCDEIEFARRVYVILRQSRKRTTSASAGDFRGSGGPPGPGFTFKRSVDALPDVAERLRHVIIENTDALRLIKHWDNPDTAMYLDPPYVGETRTARNYTVENPSIEFHERLIETVKDSKAKIILSGYNHPVYGALKDWHRIDTLRKTASESEATRYATETIWANF